MAVFVDVTYRDKLAQLEDQNGYKDLLFKSVSHELRGPLNGSMLNISSLLKQDLPQDSKEVLNMSLVCQRRLLKSIDGILDLVKINSEKFTPILQVFDLKEVIQDSMTFFEDTIQMKSIATKLEIFEGYSSAVMINSDPERVEQILYQVIDNAVKFTPPHGRLHFLAKLLPVSKIQGEEESEDRIEITIEDSGCGLSQEAIDKICSLPDVRHTRSRISDNSTGAGLGLSIVTNLLRKLGSGFKIQSEIFQGARVSFRLKSFGVSKDQRFDLIEKTNLREITDSPLLKAHYRFPDADNSALHFELEREKSIDLGEKLVSFSPSASRLVFKKKQNIESPLTIQKNLIIDTSFIATRPTLNMKLLVVDDDAFNIFALKRTLNQAGYEVLIAYNGQEAIELLKIHHLSVSIIFMDLNMPIMNGYDATKELKKSMKAKELSAVPIIACTAYAQESERQSCFEIGFDDFLIKPINPKKLAEVIQKFRITISQN